MLVAELHTGHGCTKPEARQHSGRAVTWHALGPLPQHRSGHHSELGQTSLFPSAARLCEPCMATNRRAPGHRAAACLVPASS